MSILADFSSLIMVNLQYILLVMTVMIALSLFFFITINIKLSKMNRRYSKMMEGMGGTNIEELLMGHINEVKQAVVKVEKLSGDCSRLEGRAQTCVQKVAVVRFNAFEDTGSDLSFAIALLDRKDNGVILSSIFGRSESRTYAKPVVAGQSSYSLSMEEKQALQQAQENFTK